MYRSSLNGKSAHFWSRNNVGAVVTRLVLSNGAGIILFLAEAGDFSLLQNAPTFSEAHTVSYAMGVVNFFPWK